MVHMLKGDLMAFPLISVLIDRTLAFVFGKVSGNEENGN